VAVAPPLNQDRDGGQPLPLSEVLPTPPGRIVLRVGRFTLLAQGILFGPQDFQLGNALMKLFTAIYDDARLLVLLRQ
jgi:hypothetical protein